MKGFFVRLMLTKGEAGYQTCVVVGWLGLSFVEVEEYWNDRFDWWIG